MKVFFLTAILAAASASGAVVQPLNGASSVLIVAAGSTAGANGTFFRSDITIFNLASHDETVELLWLPQGEKGPAATKIITIPARTGIRSADFVHDFLGQAGVGSIIVSGVTSAGLPDSAAVLYIGARIWTPQPGTSGTTSQSFPAIPLSTINTPAATLFATGAPGPGQIGNYRVNVGIVNVDPNNTQTFGVNVPSIGPVPPQLIITVPAMSMQQISIGSGGSTHAQVTQVSIENITPTTTKSNLWTAYASVVDNVTGDAWSELAVAGTTP